MKKFFSVLFLFVLICPLFILSGCKEEDKRTLQDFYANYLQIAEENENLVVEVIPERFNSSSTYKKVGFKYSDELQAKFEDSSSIFSYLDSYYNIMLDDALAPTFLYAQTMFNSTTAKVSTSEKDYLYDKLDKLKIAYIETANRVGDVEKTLTNSYSNRENLQKLYTSYETLIKTACELSIKISNIYFDKILTVSNPSFEVVNEKNLSNIADFSMNRLFYYKTLYLDIYINTQVIGNNIATKIVENSITSPFNITYEPYTSLKNVTYTTKKDNLLSYGEELLSYGQTLYNIQLTLEDEFEKYDKAISSINYHQTNSNSNISDYTQKLIIDKFIATNGIIYNSYYTLTHILDICFNKA